MWNLKFCLYVLINFARDCKHFKSYLLIKKSFNVSFQIILATLDLHTTRARYDRRMKLAVIFLCLLLLGSRNVSSYSMTMFMFFSFLPYYTMLLPVGCEPPSCVLCLVDEISSENISRKIQIEMIDQRLTRSHTESWFVFHLNYVHELRFFSSFCSLAIVVCNVSSHTDDIGCW